MHSTFLAKINGHNDNDGENACFDERSRSVGIQRTDGSKGFISDS